MPSRLLTALLFLGCSFPALAEDWPQFGRDKTRNAVSPEKNPPTWWQYPEKEDGKIIPGKNIRWVSDLDNPYQICGDPIIVDGLVWVGVQHTDWRTEETPNRKEDEHFSALYCLDEKTGKTLYRRLCPTQRGYWENGAWWHSHTSVPLIEGDTLWVVMNNSEVVCMDIGPLKKRTGLPKDKWVLDMRKELGIVPRYCLHFGRRCSIAGHKDWIYVITGTGHTFDKDRETAAARAPSLVCLEKASGKVVWRDDTPGKDIRMGQFASPTVIEVKGQTQVIAPQGDGWVRSFDAATGKLLWKFDTNPHDVPDEPGGLARNRERHELPSTAVFHDGRLYIGNGSVYDSPDPTSAWLYCIDPSKTGDISPEFTSGPDKGKPNPNSGMVWRYGGLDNSVKPDNKEKWRPEIFHGTVSNVAIDKGFLLATDVAGDVHCLDAKTGRRHWKHETTSEINGSPLIVDDKVYVGSFEEVWVFDLAKEKRATTQIKGEPVVCSPVFANGVLYVAAGHHLYAISGNEKQPKKELQP
ncbi:outer membrane protein assembly factor BamB family protein [Zavarzinella formosa]|uniref:outer membrane protein assembly factor BamB family protein n=1 Tax=Zavarzinella formosa TaxID=360055 RepID=UPI0002E7519B|nr:PQQ-binding-like beta-propeller repeat protein [Zavarzinella formosa]